MRLTGLTPGRTRCKTASNDSEISIHDLSIHAQKDDYPTPSLCREPGLLVRLGQWDFFERSLPKVRLMPSLALDTVANGQPVNTHTGMLF